MKSKKFWTTRPLDGDADRRQNISCAGRVTDKKRIHGLMKKIFTKTWWPNIEERLNRRIGIKCNTITNFF